MYQTGLTNKVPKESHLADCNPRKNIIQTVALGLDHDGVPFSENWEYASIVGMLLFLTNNSRPDIAYVVHQCYIFTHQPKSFHGSASKRIIRYLQEGEYKGLVISPR